MFQYSKFIDIRIKPRDYYYLFINKITKANENEFVLFQTVKYMKTYSKKVEYYKFELE
jgi:hypothetical protein